jgi:hypothetical protein
MLTIIYDIGSHLIEFVDKWSHLGHVRTIDCIGTDDILAKKCSLLGQFNKGYSLKLIVKEKPDSSKPTAQVSMELNCGICLKIILSQSVLHGGNVLGVYGIFQIPHIQLSYQT